MLDSLRRIIRLIDQSRRLVHVGRQRIRTILDTLALPGGDTSIYPVSQPYKVETVATTPSPTGAVPPMVYEPVHQGSPQRSELDDEQNRDHLYEQVHENDMPNESNPQPIATPTLARLYVQQGKLEQAEQIYEQLVAQRPDDAQSRQELSALKQTITANAATDATSTQQTIDQLYWDRAEEGLVYHWEVSTQGKQRAELVLGNPGALTLRIAGFPGDNNSPSHHDIALPETEGAINWTPGANVNLVAAAVGLLSQSGQFVSIVHCEARRI